MDQHKPDLKRIKRKALIYFSLVPIVFALCFFLPAWTFVYWHAYIYSAVIIIPMIFVVIYFLKKDPAFLERRLKMKEKEQTQKLVIIVAEICFLIGFLMPGFDFRFGWSHVPLWLVVFSNIMVLLAYIGVFFVFKENTYASRTVEIHENQKVISTGPYAIVRHPMYSFVIVMYFFTPIALGSYYAIIPFVLVFPFLIIRIFNEEKLLKKELPGYIEYCEKVKYRLIPYIW